MTELKKASHAEYFAEAAKEWDRNELVLSLAQSAVDNINKFFDLNEKFKVMEYGCGTGLIGTSIAPKVASVHAWDCSVEMLQQLDRKLEQKGMDNVITRCIDLSSESLPDEKFDLIFASMALHHIPDTTSIVQKFEQLLAPGGRVALIDLDSEDGSFHGDIPGVFHLGFNRENLSQILEENGFKTLNTETSMVFNKPIESGEMKEFSTFIITAKKVN